MATARARGTGSDARRAEVQPLGESVRALERDTRELLAAIEQLSASASAALRDQLDRRPYAALGAGLVAGYILGGGLSFRLATMLATAAGKATIAQVASRGARGSWAAPEGAPRRTS
jgi:hypothetical protein